jgi:hypothetical protein
MKKIEQEQEQKPDSQFIHPTPATMTFPLVGDGENGF